MRSSLLVDEIWLICGCDLAEWLEHLNANGNIATDLSSNPASTDAVNETETEKAASCLPYYGCGDGCTGTDENPSSVRWPCLPLPYNSCILS